MQIIAFIVAIVAVVCFLVEAFRVRPVNWLALGAAALTVAWIVQLVVTSGTPVHLG